ncbi:MAG: metallophosphatase family protein [Nitrospirota bacterium]|nr:metallophosphatase family protein [Nitrospirota bacterium]
MKIGVLSDTHVPVPHHHLPAKVFELFQDVDLILHAGDITELAVLDELRSLAPVEAVAGNMDGPAEQQRLPQKKVLQLGKYHVGLIHGKYKIDIQRDMIRKEFDKVDLIVYGHSHQPFFGKHGDMLFLNPGSPTDKVHAPYNSVAIVTLGDDIRAEIIQI